MADNYSFKVVGVTFTPQYPDNMYRLDDCYLEAQKQGESLPIVLRRNPDNPHDVNAIEVHQPLVGMLGHVPRAIAAYWAPRIDSGETWQGSIRKVAISPEHIERPGIWIDATLVS